jgi:hypothetical protein
MASIFQQDLVLKSVRSFFTFVVEIEPKETDLSKSSDVPSFRCAAKSQLLWFFSLLLTHSHDSHILMAASPTTKNTLDLTEVVVKYWTLREMRVNIVMLLLSNFNYKFESKRVKRLRLLSCSTPHNSRIKTQFSIS